MAASVILCAAVIAVCSADPKDSGVSGQYANVDEYVTEFLKEQKTLVWSDASGKNDTARITGREITWLYRNGEIADLNPNGALEAWCFNYAVRLDADSEKIVLGEDLYGENGWYYSEIGGYTTVALRYDDGSYDILMEQPVGRCDFYADREVEEQALHDWYVQEKGLELPLYMVDFSLPVYEENLTLLRYDENSHRYLKAAQRFDGDGWYLYVPVSGWFEWDDRLNGTKEWRAQSPTNSRLVLTRKEASVESVKSEYAAQGRAVTEATAGRARYLAESCLDGNVDIAYLFESGDGGCYVLNAIWDEEEIADNVYYSLEPDELRAMAESFTLCEVLNTEREATDEGSRNTVSELLCPDGEHQMEKVTLQRQVGRDMRICTHGAVGRTDFRYQYQTYEEECCTQCGVTNSRVTQTWWGEWQCD